MKKLFLFDKLKNNFKTENKSKMETKYSDVRTALYQYPKENSEDYYEIYDTLCRCDHFDDFSQSTLSVNANTRTITIEGKIDTRPFNLYTSECYFCRSCAGNDGLCSTCRLHKKKVTDELKDERIKQIKIGISKYEKLKYKKVFPKHLNVEYGVEEGDRNVVLTLIDSSEK